MNAIVSKLITVGNQPVSLGLGARYRADAPEGGPEGAGYRAAVTFLFPR